MGCCGGEKEKLEDVSAEQKWDFINLSDFNSTSCFTPLSYGVLYVSLLISVAVYGVDLFTAVNLLVFDRWSGQVKPVIPFTISRWIFAGCIILSWVFLAYRWLRAIRVIRGGGIAQSYLDPLAVRIQCVRLGSEGRGWRRFLVFAELTKSKKGSEYLALFTYFSFEAWMRIIFAQGPRNTINAMTLYSVMQLNLLPNGKHAASNGHTPIVQFFYNLQILANSDKEQAAILFGMLFSLIVWVVSALGLMVACLIYITFLWHHIPSIDGGLSGFCKRKIDSRLQKIVGIKIEEALANEDRAAFKKESKIGDRLNPIKRQPTIPLLTPEGDDALLSMPTLLRQTTQSALPPYTSSDSLPNLSHQPTLPDLSRKGSSRPAFPYRSETQSSAFSNMSYMSDAPLIDAAVPMGYVSSGRSYSPGPPSRNFSRTSTTNGRPRIDLSMTRTSQESQLSLRNPSYSSSVGRGAAGIPNRQNTGTSDYFSSTHLSNHGPPRANSQGGKTPQQVSPIDTLGRHTPRWGTDRQTPVQEYEMHSQPLSRSETYYQAYNPNMTTTSTGHISTHTSSARNFSAPSRQLSNEYFPSQPPPPQRSGTAPLPQIARYADYNQLPYEVGTGQGMPRPTVPPRAATAIPGQSAWNHNQNKPRRYQ